MTEEMTLAQSAKAALRCIDEAIALLDSGDAEHARWALSNARIYALPVAADLEAQIAKLIDAGEAAMAPYDDVYEYTRAERAWRAAVAATRGTND